MFYILQEERFAAAAAETASFKFLEALLILFKTMLCKRYVCFSIRFALKAALLKVF